MKIQPRMGNTLYLPEPNRIGVLARSSMAKDTAYAGGILGQPDEDYSQPPSPVFRLFLVSRNPRLLLDI